MRAEIKGDEKQQIDLEWPNRPCTPSGIPVPESWSAVRPEKFLVSQNRPHGFFAEASFYFSN